MSDKERKGPVFFLKSQYPISIKRRHNCEVEIIDNFRYIFDIMSSMVKKIVNAVKLLTREDLDELLSWLSDYELSQMDDWDKEIERDSEDYGRLQTTINRVRKDISEGRVKPIDKVLNNS